MGNIGGVRKRGLTLQAVGVAMREVLDARFPGVFTVTGPTPESECILVTVAGEEEPVLQWWDEGEVYPGLIGGKHPRMGMLFGYWLLSIIEYGVASRLKTRVFDEGVGYFKKEDVLRGAAPTFQAYVDKHPGSEKWWPTMKPSEQELVPEVLHPWFDGGAAG